MKQKTLALTRGAMCIALGVLFLLLGQLIETLDLTIAALTALLTLWILTEAGVANALCVYAGTALLSLLLLPSKTGALEYTVLFGLYPVVKKLCERKRWLGICGKILYCNAMIVLYAFLAWKLLGIAFPNQRYLLWLIALGNVVFWLYDLTLGMLLRFYAARLRPRLYRRFHR